MQPRDYEDTFGERFKPSADDDSTTFEFYVFPEVFAQEACQGFDSAAVLRLLRDRGHLIAEGRHLARRERLPGLGLVRCYRIKSTIFEGDE